MKPPSKEVIGLTLFFVLMAGSLAIVIFAAEELPSGILAAIRYVIKEMEPFVVFDVAISYGTTEGGAMIAEAFLKKREKAGIEKGRKEEAAKWRAWYERSQEAKRQGQEFVEPPPPMPGAEGDAP